MRVRVATLLCVVVTQLWLNALPLLASTLLQLRTGQVHTSDIARWASRMLRGTPLGSWPAS